MIKDNHIKLHDQNEIAEDLPSSPEAQHQDTDDDIKDETEGTDMCPPATRHMAEEIIPDLTEDADHEVPEVITTEQLVNDVMSSNIE